MFSSFDYRTNRKRCTVQRERESPALLAKLRNMTCHKCYVSCTAHCNIITQHKSTKWGFYKLMSKFLIFCNIIYIYIYIIHLTANGLSPCDSGYFTCIHHHHHHVPEGLGVFPVPWSSRWSCSLHLFLGRPMFLRPFGLYCSACFGSLFVSTLCRCCSHLFTCIQNMKLVTTRFKSGGLHEKHVVATWNVGNRLSICL